MEDTDKAPRGYYPGSREPLPSLVPGKTEKPAKKRDLETWDARPTRKVHNGTSVDLFPIGAVCAALGRKPVTIRLWIRQGHLPAATLRMPDKNGVKGRRLYTREQIEALVTVAERHGFLTTDRVDWSKHATFVDDVRDAWSRI